MKKGRFFYGCLLAGIQTMVFAEMIAFSQTGSESCPADVSASLFDALPNENCISNGTHTNSRSAALSSGHITFSTRSNVIGKEIIISLDTIYGTPGYRDIVTTYNPEASCTSVTNRQTVNPRLDFVSYRMTGPFRAAGIGNSVRFKPMVAGFGTVTFFVSYQDGIGGTQTFSVGGYYGVGEPTNSVDTSTNITIPGPTNCTVIGTSTNCIPGSMSPGSDPGSTNCLGQTVNVYLGSLNTTPGYSQTTTSYSDPTNCPSTTNTAPVYPSVLSVNYTISGPYSGSGSGSSASFTPTNTGSGTVTFTVTYDDGCGGTEMTTAFRSYSVSSCSSNCVETSRATNCLSDAYVTLTASTNSVQVCQGSSVSASASPNYFNGAVDVAVYYSNCPSTHVTNSTSAMVVSNWWTVTGPGSYNASGSGLSASFTPTNCGSGTITFYLQYSNQPPCTLQATATTSVSCTVHCTTKTTNCLTAPSVTLTGGTNNVLTNCLGSPISVSVTAQSVTGKVEIVTSSSSTNCPTTRVTNNVPPTIFTNWWSATGPGSFTTNGSGLSATFIPTNVGNGTITFTLQYSNPPPCGTGTSTVTWSTNYTIYKLTITPTNFDVCAGDPITFVASGGPGTNYVWNPSGTLSANGQTNTLVFTNASSNQVVTVTYGGCSASATGTVTRLTLTPTNFFTAVGVTNTFVAGGGPGTNYVWTPTGLLSPDRRTNWLVFSTPAATQVVTVAYGSCSLSATGTVALVEILSKNDVVLSSTNNATNAVRYTVKGRVTPAGLPGLTYLWKVDGGVPPQTVGIKIYSYDYASGDGTGASAGYLYPTNMAASDMTSSNLSLFWTRPAVRNVTLEATKNGKTISTNIWVNVIQDADPNRYIYSKENPSEEYNPKGDGVDFYNVCDNHGNWHHDKTTGAAHYDANMFTNTYGGQKFFTYHKAIIDLHNTWRSLFGVTTPINTALGSAKPSYFTNGGGLASSVVYHYVRLEEFPSQEQLGDDVHPWHAAGHNNQSTVDTAEGTGNTPDITNTFTNLRGRTNNFWSWHGNIEAFRNTVPLGASPATVTATVPAAGATNVPNGRNNVVVVFSKGVSQGGPLNGTASESNLQSVRTNYFTVTPPGGGAITSSVVLASADWKTNTFTVPSMTATGVWRAALIGTPRGYVGFTNTFTVLP